MLRSAPHRPRRSRVLALAVGASALAACTSVTDPGRTATVAALSASEAAGLAAGFAAQAQRAPTQLSVPATVNPDGSWTFTAPCALGGSIAGTAAFTTTPPDAAGAWTVTATVTTTPRSCVVPTGGRQIAITGDPSLTVAIIETGMAPAGTPTLGTVLATTTHVSGAFTWHGGRCAVDYTATQVLRGATPTTTVTGTVCGARIPATAATR